MGIRAAHAQGAEATVPNELARPTHRSTPMARLMPLIRQDGYDRRPVRGHQDQRSDVENQHCRSAERDRADERHLQNAAASIRAARRSTSVQLGNSRCAWRQAPRIVEISVKTRTADINSPSPTAAVHASSQPGELIPRPDRQALFSDAARWNKQTGNKIFGRPASAAEEAEQAQDRRPASIHRGHRRGPAIEEVVSSPDIEVLATGT